MALVSLPIQLHRLIYLRDLLRELISRDMKLRYKRSFLGFLWSVLNPLAQLLVIVFVFTFVLPLNIPNYPSTTFIGLIAWGWFQGSLYAACGAIVENRELIRRPHFPIAILPVVTVTTQLIHFLLAVPILLIFLFLEGIPPTSALLALPFVVALEFVLTLGIAYLVATLNVSFRDTQYLLGVILMLAFFLTPVFYSFESVPERYKPLYLLNPMTWLLGAYRAIFIAGVFPDFKVMLGLGILFGAILFVSYRGFKRTSYRFVEEL